MRKTYKICLFVLMIFVLANGIVFAAENEYIIKREIIYQNNRKSALKDGFVEIMLGQLDFTQYADDEYLKVTPKPDEIKQDKFGNLFAYYDAKGLLPTETIVINIERKVKTKAFATSEQILARSNGSVTDENRIYVEPQEKIESDDEKIIDKANEITQDLTTDYRKAAEIFEFVNTTMKYNLNSNSSNSGALAALNNLSGVCEEFATLFVALCRAEEIPSRVVAGYKIDKSESGDEDILIDHAWAEIYLDDYGWLPVEPTVEYTVNEIRMPYWNSFCALPTADYIPTEVYECENGNRTYQIVVEKSYLIDFEMNAEITKPAQNTFADIYNHSWANDAIQSLYEKGIVKGYSEVEYGPDRNISRIEFICMLSRTLRNMHQVSAEKANVYYYPSYDRNHWSKEDYDFLMRCYQFRTPSDIMSAGFNNIVDVFGTNADLNVAITRGEVVALMDMFMDDAVFTDGFADVDVNTRFYNSINKAYSTGLIEGYPDGTFRPYNTITRAEMATILGRYVAGNSYIAE